MGKSLWRRPVVLGLVLLALLGLDYAVFVGTAPGRHMDDRAIVDPTTGRSWAVDRPATSELGHAVAAASFILLASAAVLMLTLRGKGLRLVLVAAVVVTGAALTAQVLKPALGAVDLLGGVEERRLGASFPSGHSTVAMSLGLVLIWAVPHAWIARAAIVAAAYSTAVGLGLLVLGWHHPSDVVAGYFIAGMWSVAIASSFRRRPPFVAREGALAGRLGRGGGQLWPIAGAIAALAVLSGLALPLIGLAHDSPGKPLPPALGEAAAAITLAAAGVAAAVGPLRLRHRTLSVRSAGE